MLMEKYEIHAVVNKSGKFFVAEAVEIKLAGQGRTREQAIKDLREAFELWLETSEPEELRVLKKIEDLPEPVLRKVKVVAPIAA